jgi:tetratricopeptide (TPR) repeat protein
MIRTAKFVNRTREIRQLQTELRSLTEANKIVFVHGTTGVGKSALTRKFSDDQSAHVSVRVRVTDAKHADGYLVGRLAQEISRVEEHRDGMSLARYVREVPGEEVRHWYYRLLLGAVSGGTLRSALPAAAKIEFERLENQGAFSSDQIFLRADTDTTAMLLGYLKYLFVHQRYVIAVENIQTIDDSSARTMPEVLMAPTGQFLLLEYTQGGTATSLPLSNVKGLFDDVADVRQIEVRKLSWDDLRPYLAPSTIERIAQRVYVTQDGNLRQLQDLEYLLADEATESEVGESPTAERLRRLQKPQMLTLAAIVAHSSPVHAETLDALYSHMRTLHDGFVDLEAEAASLQHDGLLRFDNGRWTVDHDSIGHVAAAEPQYERYFAIAYQAWSIYYGAAYQQRNFALVSENEMLSLLFHFYLHSDVMRIFSILDDVERVATTSVAPRTAMEFLRKLVSYLETTAGSESTLQRVLYTLIDIAYAVGMFADAAELLERITVDSDRRRVCEVALLNRLDEHEGAIANALRYLDDRHEAHSSYELSLKLLLMISFRSSNQFDRAEAVFRDIARDRQYDSLPEYGYFLRNAEIVLDRGESIAYIKKSIDFFHQRAMVVAEAHSRISLGMYLILAGRLDDAEEQHRAVATLISGKTNERHIVFSNQAAVRIYRGEASFNEALELLSQARATLSTPFDTISIYNNMFVIYALSGRTESAEATAARLQQLLPSEPDRVLHRTIYYNLAEYDRRHGLRSSHERFFNAAREAAPPTEEYWSYRLDGGTFPEGSAMRASIPYDLAFLSYWHFPILATLQH